MRGCLLNDVWAWISANDIGSMDLETLTHTYERTYTPIHTHIKKHRLSIAIYVSLNHESSAKISTFLYCRPKLMLFETPLQLLQTSNTHFMWPLSFISHSINYKQQTKKTHTHTERKTEWATIPLHSCTVISWLRGRYRKFTIKINQTERVIVKGKITLREEKFNV